MMMAKIWIDLVLIIRKIIIEMAAKKKLAARLKSYDESMP